MARTRKLEIQLTADEKDAVRGFDRVGKAAKDAQKDIDKVGDADPFGKIEDAGGGFADKLGGLGEMAGGAFATAFAAAGAVGVGLLAEGIQSAMEQELATDKLAAQLGAEGQFAEDLGKISGDLWVQGFGESFSDVTSVVEETFRAGLFPEDASVEQIEAITAKVATFTDVLDQDVQGSLNAVSQMLRTGLAKDADEAFDILTRGIQQGGDKAGDLMDTFNEYSTQFRKLGLSGAEAMGLMVQGVQAGARDADIVADALKEFSIRAVDGSELTQQAFEDLGLSADEMVAKFAEGGPQAAAGLDQVLEKLAAVEDPATRSQIAVALFGTQAEDLGAALNALDPTTAVGALGEVEGSTDDLSSAYDNAASTVETFKREALQKLTEFVAAYVIPKIQELIGWVREHKEGIKDVVEAAGHWIQGLQRVIGWLGAVVEKIQVVIGWVDTLSGKFGGLLSSGVDNLVSGKDVIRSAGTKTGKTIPKAAEGGIVNRPTLLLAGEAGPEAIVPLGSSSGFGGVHVHLEVGTLVGRDAERELIQMINDGIASGHRLQAQGRGL